MSRFARDPTKELALPRKRYRVDRRFRWRRRVGSGLFEFVSSSSFRSFFRIWNRLIGSQSGAVLHGATWLHSHRGSVSRLPLGWEAATLVQDEVLVTPKCFGVGPESEKMAEKVLVFQFLGPFENRWHTFSGSSKTVGGAQKSLRCCTVCQGTCTLVLFSGFTRHIGMRWMHPKTEFRFDKCCPLHNGYIITTLQLLHWRSHSSAFIT